MIPNLSPSSSIFHSDLQLNNSKVSNFIDNTKNSLLKELYHLNKRYFCWNRYPFNFISFLKSNAWESFVLLYYEEIKILRQTEIKADINDTVFIKSESNKMNQSSILSVSAKSTLIQNKNEQLSSDFWENELKGGQELLRRKE